MMLGTIFCNICDFSEELMERVDRWTAPLFVLFFVLSKIADEMTVIAFVGFVSNLLGALLFKLSGLKKVRGNDNEQGA